MQLQSVFYGQEAPKLHDAIKAKKRWPKPKCECGLATKFVVWPTSVSGDGQRLLFQNSAKEGIFTGALNCAGFCLYIGFFTLGNGREKWV
jgi:hypothetical protein